MSLPRPVEEGVGEALRKRGGTGGIRAVEPVGGGCINHGARVVTDDGDVCFLKWNRTAPPGMFEAEADGLETLAKAAAGAIRVPKPLVWGGSAEASWLLLEYVSAGPATARAKARLGEGLARIHTEGGGASFGWERDNWIGSLEQPNAPSPSWADFWRDHRIGPQLARARDAGFLGETVYDRLVDAIPVALSDVVDPELVHGDLWGGNWLADERGDPVLIDPAVYHGHGEVDLAMTELFGGFGAGFYSAYRSVRGRDPAYDAYRRDLYQLYYLMVHVNLFGSSYVAGCAQAARRVVSELAV